MLSTTWGCSDFDDFAEFADRQRARQRLRLVSTRKTGFYSTKWLTFRSLWEESWLVLRQNVSKKCAVSAKQDATQQNCREVQGLAVWWSRFFWHLERLLSTTTQFLISRRVLVIYNRKAALKYHCILASCHTNKKSVFIHTNNHCKLSTKST